MNILVEMARALGLDVDVDAMQAEALSEAERCAPHTTRINRWNGERCAEYRQNGSPLLYRSRVVGEVGLFFESTTVTTAEGDTATFTPAKAEPIIFAPDTREQDAREVAVVYGPLTMRSRYPAWRRERDDQAAAGTSGSGPSSGA